MGPKRAAEDDGNEEVGQSRSKRQKTGEITAEEHPLLRDSSTGMNPVNLLTGYYGTRGEHLKHVAHEGALRLPSDALEYYSAVPFSRDAALPDLDSIERPLCDPLRKEVVITDLSKEIALGVQDLKRVLKTVAKNRVIKGEAVTRIRGGGGEEFGGGTHNGAPATNEGIPGMGSQVASSGSVLSQPTPSTTLSTSQPMTTVATAPTSSATTVGNGNSAVPSAVGSGPSQTTSGASASTPFVQTLPSTPAPVWEQHKPGTGDEMAVDPSTSSPKPGWFSDETVSDTEKTCLPEWFNSSASHRTESTYLSVRNRMMQMSQQLGTRYLTVTMTRRSIAGDAGSLMRLHSFLSSHNLINEHSINESAPIPIAMQQGAVKKSKDWDDSLKTTLLEAIVRGSEVSDQKETKKGFVPIDWKAVATTVGHGKTPTECEQQFLSMPIQSNNTTLERSITPDAQSMLEEPSSNDGVSGPLTPRAIEHLVSRCDADVVHAVTVAALQATRNSLSETKDAAVVGLLVSKAEEDAQRLESEAANVLGELVDLRMKKLENRLALLDDAEGMIEAERAALELERRDLYTARCRHWFQGP